MATDDAQQPVNQAELWVSVPMNPLTHWQTMKLVRYLEMCDIKITPAQAFGHIVALQTWQALNFPSGHPPSMLVSDETLAEGAGWRKNAEQLVSALEDAELILRTGTEVRFYFWGGFGEHVWSSVVETAERAVDDDQQTESSVTLQ